MVRQLLGNIKGPKGDTGARGPQGAIGPTGPEGSLKDEKIGVLNKIDIKKFTQFGDTTPVTEFEIEEGILHFSNLVWQIYTIEELNGVKHVFRVEDYTSDPTYYQGLMRLIIRSTESDEEVVNTVVDRGETVDVDLTGRARQEYRIEFRPTGSNHLSGFIEKPMLVEGDIPVLWSHPDTVGYLSTGFSNVVITSQGLNNDGTKLPITSSTALTKNCSVSEGSIVLNPGIWKLTVEITFENTTGENLFYIRAIQNSNTIATSRGRLNGTTYSLNLVIRTTGDPIDLYAVQNSDSPVSTLSASFNRVMAEYLDTY